ncbi:MAG: hypothetical protein K6T31_02940 [Alicyclobacillus sp.]|nr:hypothetical protein [Alicyclobacillus sp.]
MKHWILAGLLISSVFPVSNSNLPNNVWAYPQQVTSYEQQLLNQLQSELQQLEQLLNSVSQGTFPTLPQWPGVNGGVNEPTGGGQAGAAANAAPAGSGEGGRVPFAYPHSWHNRARRLPSVSSGSSVNVGNIKVSAADAGVSAQAVQQAAQLIQQIALPQLQQTLGQTPGNTQVVLFSSKRSYAQALSQAGMNGSDLAQAVSETGGITLGQTVWIPLYNLNDESDLANVLTHELTHVVFNQEGVGDQLPTWINEGTAWFNGLQAQAQLNPAAVQQLQNEYNQEVTAAARSGSLLPLTADEQTILNAPYNVEWEDYLAVQQLVQNFGLDRYKAFLQSIPKQGVDSSFQSAFGQSLNSFVQQFDQNLAQSS